MSVTRYAIQPSRSVVPMLLAPPAVYTDASTGFIETRGYTWAIVLVSQAAATSTYTSVTVKLQGSQDGTTLEGDVTGASMTLTDDSRNGVYAGAVRLYGKAPYHRINIDTTGTGITCTIEVLLIGEGHTTAPDTDFDYQFEVS